MDLTITRNHQLFIQSLLITLFFLMGYCFASNNSEGIQEYQKNLHLNPQHKQKVADAITRYRNADNLWDVLRDQFTLNHYEESYAVQAKIEWYMNNQDFLLRAASRAAPYLYYIHKQVRKRHLPAELVLLPIVESGYNPFSVSSMGASGIWQLMPGTASGLGVKHDWWYDGRLDVVASTRGALNYLAYLQSFFEGNWLLALAAYNTGEGNVLAAIKRNIREGRDTDFWSLPLAQQTRDYVPSLLALATIINYPDKYPVYFPPVRNAPYLARMDVGKQINLKLAAKLAGISHRKIMQLNSGYKGPTTSRGRYKLVLPIENIEKFSENLARSFINKEVKWIHYKVKSGDTLLSISKKFKTNTRDIRKLNHLAKNTIHTGTHLLIPNKTGISKEFDDDTFVDSEILAANKHHTKNHRKKHMNIATALHNAKKSKKSHLANLHPGDTIYVVRDYDSIWKIAKHYHVSIHALKQANKLVDNHLNPGRQLLIPTHRIKTAKQEKHQEKHKQLSLNRDITYKVRRGDTIDKIARKFKTTSSAIRLANLIDNNTLMVGDHIIIPAYIRS